MKTFNIKKTRIISAIFMVLIMCVFSPITGYAQDNDQAWQRLLIQYAQKNEFWGYDMADQTEIPTADYWKNENWKSVTMFQYRNGKAYSETDPAWVYAPLAWVTKEDDTHIALHNIFRNFRGLFNIDEAIDLYLVGEIDFEAKTITFQPQEYYDGYIFASTDEGGDNDYSFEELKPVTLKFRSTSAATWIETSSDNGSIDNSFAFYKLNEQGKYSASIGECGFSICGRHKVVSYVLYPTGASVLPSNNPINEIEGVRFTFGQNLYENSNIIDPITVTKDGEPIEVTATGSISRESNNSYIVELANSLKEPGSYEFTIPQGIIGNTVYNSSSFKSGVANPELKYTFTIVDAEKLEYDFDYLSVSPANESDLDKIGEIRITFPSAVSINETYVDHITSNSMGIESVSNDESDASVIVVKFISNVVKAQDFTVHFPQGVFGDEKYGDGFMVGHANPSFDLKYTISGKYEMFFDLSYSSIDPEPNQSYDEISEVKITFEVPVVVNEEIAATAFMYKDSYQQIDPYKSLVVSPTDDKTVVLTMKTPLTEEGLYYITIPQGAVGDATYGEDFTYGHANKEITFRYTITGAAGIEDIANDNHEGKEQFFNLQGVQVNKDNLTPGIYIRKRGGKAEKICVK